VDPKQIIADLLQANGGPCALDKIHLPYPEAGGGPAAKFGGQLFLPEADRASLRERALQFLIDYGRLFPDEVDQFLPREQRRTVRLRGDPGERIRADGDKFPVQSGYSASLFGQVTSVWLRFLGIPEEPPHRGPNAFFSGNVCRQSRRQVVLARRQAVEERDDFRGLHHVGVFCVHVAQVDGVARLRTVEAAFFGQ
jgi:hypothetical protein